MTVRVVVLILVLLAPADAWSEWSLYHQKINDNGIGTRWVRQVRYEDIGDCEKAAHAYFDKTGLLGVCRPTQYYLRRSFSYGGWSRPKAFDSYSECKAAAWKYKERGDSAVCDLD